MAAAVPIGAGGFQRGGEVSEDLSRGPYLTIWPVGVCVIFPSLSSFPLAWETDLYFLPILISTEVREADPIPVLQQPQPALP